MTSINQTISSITQNVVNEMSHKNLTKEEKSFLVNADRFLLVSGQRGYFYEQKKNLMIEIERLNDLYKSYYYKKKEWKKKYIDKEEENVKKVNKLEQELNLYKNRV
jgi:hypothetical protein